MSDSHNNLPFPSSNFMEDMETISRNKFCPLFAPSLFEARPEHYRDKGIDFVVELKKDNAYTNFRFAVQLKSTSSVKPNRDGSISFPVEISNINYLQNYGMPAYYVLYSHNNDLFYAESCDKVYANFKEKYTDGDFPEKFSVKFSKLLDKQLIDEIYQKTFDHGTLLRRLAVAMKQSAAGTDEQAVVIGREKEVYSVAEHIVYIDKYGPYLINNFRFKEIIDAEEKAKPRNAVSHIFNLVCGMAYVQRGSLFKAMEFLKAAEKQREHFDTHQQAVLFYTLLNARHLLGIISKEDYDLEVSKIRENEGSGAYFEIDRAYEVLSKSGNATDLTIKAFYGSMRKIINNEKNDARVLVKAHAKILDAEESILFHDLKLNFVYFIGRTESPLQSKTYLQWLELEKFYYERMKNLASFAARNNYLLGVLNLSSTRVKWNYQKIFYRHFLSHYNNNAFNISSPISNEDFNELGSCCLELDRIANSYEMLEDISNKISCLANKFEILLLMKLQSEALETKNEIMEIVETHDLKALKEKYTWTMNGNSQHEVFVRDFTLHMNKIREVALTFNYDTTAPFTKEELDRMEQNTKWSIEAFFEFDLPDLTSKQLL